MIAHHNSAIAGALAVAPAQALVTRREDGEPVTTSIAIAVGTDNTHDAVIKLVRRHLKSLRTFGEVGFEIRHNPQGSGTEFALLNEQQSSLLISFMRNSAIVVDFKVTLIRQFYEMRAALRSAPDQLASLPPEQRALIAVMVDNAAIKQRQDKLDAAQAVQAEQIQRITAKQSAFEDGYAFFTALGFCAMRGVKMVMTDLQRLGRSAASHSKRMNIPVERVRDPRFGMVNSYHETALDAAFVELHKGL